MGRRGAAGAAAHRLTRPRPAGTVSLLLLVYLVFTKFWPISALYLAWVIFDWDTPEKGTAWQVCGEVGHPPFLSTTNRSRPPPAKKMAERGVQRVHVNYLAVSLS